MLSIKINVVYTILVTITAGIQSLVELPAMENSNGDIVETGIRNIMTKLYDTFQFLDVRRQPRLKQYFSEHNYFISTSKTDDDNLKEILGLSNANNFDNNIQYMIRTINEVLDKSDKNREVNGNTSEENHIETFIRKLKHLKEKHATKGEVINAVNLMSLNNDETVLENGNMYYNVSRIKTRTGNEKILIDEEYWKPSGRRLYRGFRTSIKHFPFMASVQFFKKFQCAGSIIKNDLVITSASCLQLSWNNRFFRENPPFISVQVGSNYYEHGGENIGVQEIYFYPTYNPKTLQNNLAIMRLSRKIAFKKTHKRVRKIDIDRDPSTLGPVSGYDRVTLVGWGAKDSSNIIYDVLRNKLSYADLDLYPLSDCRDHYSRKFVTKKNFCAGFYSKGGGACNRDAGGPAIIAGTLIGIISFGSPICGAPDSPTVFTKLGFYADWIDEILDQEVPYIYKRTTTSHMVYTIPDKVTTKTIKMTPIVIGHEGLTTYEPVVPQKDDYYDFSPSVLGNEVVKERFQVGTITPIIEPSTPKIYKNKKQRDKAKISSESIETGTEFVRGITLLEGQAIKDHIRTMLDNVDIDKLISDKDTSKEDFTEEPNKSKKDTSILKQSTTYLLSSSEGEDGLSIPVEPFQNAQLRVSPEKYAYDKESESMLFDFVSQAIEEEINRQIKKRYF